MEARLICKFLATLLLCGSALIPASAQPIAKHVPEWDSLFQRTSGWIGADGALSIPLTTNKTLWLFGDTFVGEIKDGRRTNAVMINNSIAIQVSTNRPQFFYRTNVQNKPASFFTSTKARGYFWPFHGIRTADGLFVFLHQVENVKTGTPFGFHITGLWLAQISNPDDAPPRWKISEKKFPFSKCSDDGLVTFSSSLLRHENFIYAFGEDSRRSRGRRGMIVGRVPERHFGDMKQWRFWDGANWQRDFERCAVICTNVASEFSVSWQPAFKRFILVLSEGLGGKIIMESSPAPEGTWGNRTTLYEPPEMKTIEKVFSYAGKGHPELSADDELLVTYVVNSWSFENLFNDARLYWPRFVRINFALKRD